MPRGGVRAGAGRPKGSKDGNGVITRVLTQHETLAIAQNVQVIQQQVRLAAWQELAKQLAKIGSLPAKEALPILAMALKYTSDTPQVAVVVQQQPSAEPTVSGGDVVRERLRKLAAGQHPELAAQHRELVAVEEIVDAEIVPEPVEVRREA
jgi:hypothetical protein